MTLFREPTIYPHETVIERAKGAFGKPFVLVHVATATEIAGSGTRQVNECYRVVHVFDGNRHSKAFKTLESTKAEFDAYTKPITEMRA